MKNSAYLKKYVENHPNNKMAWYLLGKEYEQNGQEGKARYCYIQAGSVYEAFESSKIPEDLWMGYEAELLHASQRQEQRSRLIRKIGLALLLLLFLWLPSAQAPGPWATTSNKPVAGAVDSRPRDEQSTKREVGADVHAASTKQRAAAPRFTAIGYTPGGRGVLDDFGSLLAGSETKDHHQVLLAMDKKGKWLNWSHQMPVVYEVQSLGNGRTSVQSYDQAACLCTPPDPGKLKNKAVKWIARQESLAVLSSAMLHYKEKKGDWPSSLDDLTQPFPNNWLAGTNIHMKEAFEPMLRELAKREQSGGETPGDAESGSIELAFEQGDELFFTQPLEVIVDTSSHRLVVVSGPVILRSYLVGLGGDKTPEGTYRITDKVVNPNGRPDGEFGTRGMQLSDTNYAIHGTNEPESIGGDESLGCVRMGKKDVEELFDLLPVGTKVTLGKGGLPDQDLTPTKRFKLGDRPDQSNPHRTYRWLQ
ncbi:L,D-transpeptidase family protein [Paenibacillus lentus]|uniref:L,D-transpeptidase n=1 Tax=Paenibacillus lentus TaxID=1338368 RepID=A0A3Q8SD97_9BACL|nr:L,D-transpeptidase family protein [Paenibacillus lentus]AZK47995.1 L,D-transpeptidase [Paenibacillus lentus]